MYVKDFQHRFLLVNKSFAEAQNINPQDMISRPDTDFFSEELCLGNPDKGMRGFHADDSQAFQGQLVHNPRNIVTWADGTPHIYDTYKIPLAGQSGKIYAALVYSRDITEQQEAEYEREAAFNTLQKTLHDVINTMAKIVEMRDPYTSGHQGRVAGLAGAIAGDMKLEDSRIEHLMMAASIHDVGKMYVPADILSKPGKLSEIEWEMIKTHVQGSYEILKDLEFSQPIAMMALQHHERLDGSGYPNGLKGDEMLLEAKILAVADVVEAMSSHRPYRPALGIDKALEEIYINRGVLYDPDAVDACVKLFREQSFKFEG
jgi:response regulator RpfG family c-di-GMP phosphodiesterase